jgi:hypothetical protein
MAEKSKTYDPPQDPMKIFGRMMFITNIGVAIQLGNNWRNFGREKWRSLSIWLPIGLIAAALVIIIGGVLFVANDYSPTVMGYAFTFGMAAWVGAMGSLMATAYMQHGAYKLYQESKDMQALLDYKYRIVKWQIMVGVAVLGVIAVGLALTLTGNIF